MAFSLNNEQIHGNNSDKKKNRTMKRKILEVEVEESHNKPKKFFRYEQNDLNSKGRGGDTIKKLNRVIDKLKFMQINPQSQNSQEIFKKSTMKKIKNKTKKMNIKLNSDQVDSFEKMRNFSYSQKVPKVEKKSIKRSKSKDMEKMTTKILNISTN